MIALAKFYFDDHVPELVVLLYMYEKKTQCHYWVLPNLGHFIGVQINLVTTYPKRLSSKKWVTDRSIVQVLCIKGTIPSILASCNDRKNKMLDIKIEIFRNFLDQLRKIKLTK